MRKRRDIFEQCCSQFVVGFLCPVFSHQHVAQCTLPQALSLDQNNVTLCLTERNFFETYRVNSSGGFGLLKLFSKTKFFHLSSFSLDLLLSCHSSSLVFHLLSSLLFSSLLFSSLVLSRIVLSRLLLFHLLLPSCLVSSCLVLSRRLLHRLVLSPFDVFCLVSPLPFSLLSLSLSSFSVQSLSLSLSLRVMLCCIVCVVVVWCVFGVCVCLVCGVCCGTLKKRGKTRVWIQKRLRVYI